MFDASRPGCVLRRPGTQRYLIPLSDRRASLRSVDWVKDASVARMWPIVCRSY